MQFAIRIGTSGGKFARLLIIAAVFVLGGMVLGLADPDRAVPVSGWAPALIGLAVAAVAVYRRFARPVVITIDQAGIRVPRQVQLLPWGRIESVRPTTRFGFARFLIVRAVEPKTIPGFAAGRGAAGLTAPKVEPDEIALNLTGAEARLDELTQAVRRVAEIVADARRSEADEDRDDYDDEPREPADPLADPVVQRVADNSAVVAGPLRWLGTIFAPLFGLFAVWALLATTEAGDMLVLLIAAAAIGGLWLIASPILMLVKTTADRCPGCKLPVRYFKAHAGRPVTCPSCRHVWPAGAFKIR